MKRAFNYTGRKSIPSGAVLVSVDEGGPDGIPTFEVVFDGLGSLGLAETNKLVLEPYVGALSMRFECGTVGSPTLPEDRRLTDIDQGAAIRFRVLVIDDASDPCRIVASGVISAGDKDEAEHKRSILQLTETASLGERLWRLDLEGDAMPELLVNSRFPGMKARLIGDPLVQGLVFPAVVAELLNELLRGHAQDDCAWVKAWSVYAESLAKRQLPEDDYDDDDIDEFIRDCVEAFCDQHRFAERVINLLKGQADD